MSGAIYRNIQIVFLEVHSERSIIEHKCNLRDQERSSQQL